MPETDKDIQRSIVIADATRHYRSGEHEYKRQGISQEEYINQRLVKAGFGDGPPYRAEPEDSADFSITGANTMTTQSPLASAEAEAIRDAAWDLSLRVFATCRNANLPSERGGAALRQVKTFRQEFAEGGGESAIGCSEQEYIETRIADVLGGVVLLSADEVKPPQHKSRGEAYDWFTSELDGPVPGLDAISI